MGGLRRLLLRLYHSVRPGAGEVELDREVGSHLTLLEDDYLRRGLTPEAARREARRTLGGVAQVKESYRDARSVPQLSEFARDARYGLRLLMKQRSFSVIAVLTLALGTGASAAIFSVIDAALLRPLPYPHPEQLVTIGVSSSPADKGNGGSAPSLDDLRAWSVLERGPLSYVAVERTVFPDRVFDAGLPEHLKSMNVTEQYFPLFGVSPILGRNFTSDDMRADAAPAIMLSYGFWQSRFGGDRTVLNRAVRFDGEAATVVGVLPPEFGQTVPIWRALQIPLDSQMRRGMGWTVIGRFRSGVTIDTASEQLSGVLSSDSRFPHPQARIRSMLSETRGNYRTTVTVTSAAVALIVLIACVNIAGLLLARGEARQTEMAIRGALGAGRGRLLCQLLTESVVLSAIGGLGGLLLATLALHAVVANIPIALPGAAPARMSTFVLGSTMCVVGLNAVLFGLVPAIRASKVSSTRLAAESRRQQASTPSLRAGQVLVAIEVALAVVMLAGAGLMLRSFSRLMTVDLGFDPGSYLTMKVEPLDQKSATAALYYPALLQSIRLIPGVVAAGAIDHAPLADGAAVTAVRRPGGAWEQMIQIETALPGYFEAVGLTAHQGRLLTGADIVGPSVVVISEGAARLFFPDGPAVGRQLQLSNVTADVVGVVGDARHFGPADNDKASPCVYRPLGSGANASDGPVRFTVVVRPGSGAHDLSDQLRRAAAGVGPAVIIDGIQYGTDWLDKRVMLPRQRTVLLSLLGALGLLLVIIGVFGMTSFAVARRTREIGIRIAFGANPTQVVGRMLRDALVPILVGICVGTGLAWLTSGVVKGFLFRTSPSDPITFALVGMTLGVVGALAAWIPARRAARVDPVVALRAD